MAPIRYLKSFFLFFLILASFFIFIPIEKVHAETVDFVHFIRSSYTIRGDKSASIEYSFTTTNKVSNNYLKTFLLNLPFQPKKISVVGSSTTIKTKEVKQVANKNLYSLEIEFPIPVYGLNKSFEWKLTFEVEDFVLDHSIQSAIIIPTFNDQSSISGFETNIKIPVSFGEVRYVYGNGTMVETDEINTVTFKGSSVGVSNYIILLGTDQEYFFQTLKVTDGAKIHLPMVLPYQELLYTQFPVRTVNSGDNINSRIFPINSDEAIKAFVKSSLGYEKDYVNEKDDISNQEIVKAILSKIDTSNLSKFNVAKKVYDVVYSDYELNDYTTNIDTSVDLFTNKKKVNPAELNKIFRECLTSLNIENRGVYGYVFPVQPFQRNDYVTQEHVWSEFWDGDKWISVDPTWKVSSGGTDYFDKNGFHHVKFGTYHNIAELNTFFANSGLISLIPVKYASNVEKKINIEMSAYKNTYLSKEFRVVVRNKSNQMMKINSIFPTLDLNGISLKDNKIDINTVLYPESELNFTIPLEYGLLLKNKEGSVSMNIEYEDLNKVSSSKNFSHSITVRSNISRYLSQIILGIVIFFVFISLGSFTLYKKRI